MNIAKEAMYMKVKVKLLSRVWLCDPMDCSLPGSSLHGILQARVLEWVVISFSRASSLPRDWTLVSGIPGRHFNLWATREVKWPLIENQGNIALILNIL